MLTLLTIKNLVIAKHLELEFDQGLSVLTGETGAGKSIIIDALGLVLGDRADSGLVRKDAARADVIACFDYSRLTEVKQWLIEQQLDDEGDCIIKRSIQANGRSKGFINGQAVSLGQLKALGEKLVNIHGQHAHQLLLHSEHQELLLDEFSNTIELKKSVNQLYRQWQQLTDKYQQIVNQSDEDREKAELLHYQLSELQMFAPEQDEFEQLEEDYKKLSHAAEIMNQLQNISSILSENEAFNIEQALGSCHKTLDDLSTYDESLRSIDEMINNAWIQVSEARIEINHYLHQLDSDPQLLAETEQRLSQYHELSRKHHCEAQLLFEQLSKLEKQSAQFENQDDILAELGQQILSVKKQYFDCAEKLSAKRKQNALTLAKEVKKHIHQLGIEHADFLIDLTIRENIDEPQKNGLESVHFMVSTNPGQPHGSLAKVASGGELSRISLAIQVVCAQYKSLPCLIFDEVDVGVGGKIAEMIGDKMNRLSKRSQILCVTHQAQVAAHADQHFLVSKKVQNNSTTSLIEPLNDKEVIEELSRMLSGADITDTTRQHSREMLQQARSKHH